MVNLSAFVKWHAACTPDRVSLVFGPERISYSDFYDRILRMAAFLKRKGIGADDVVAAFMKNSAAFLEIAFATSHLGAVFLPVNYRLARDEVEYILGDAGARLLFADDEYADLFKGLAGVEVVLVDDGSQRDSRKLAGTGLPIPGITARKTGDLFRLMYTSGTTDRPKGVIHSYENFYWKSMAHIISLNLSMDDRCLVVGPLYHVGAFDSLLNFFSGF